jgi:hypothetical protein
MSEHGFGPHADMALYDIDRNRITPWFPVGTSYVGTPDTAGKQVRHVGIRDFDEFELIDVLMTIVDGVNHTIVVERRQMGRYCVCNDGHGWHATDRRVVQ